jgi:SAM-dependent methyltransferase
MSRTGELRIAAGRRFARVATVAVTRVPRLWPVFRGLVRLQFQALAPAWEGIVGPDHLAALQAALDQLDPPRRALDLGTGTGLGAFTIARRFPEAEVVGADLAPGMVEQARLGTPPELAGRVRFEVADASRLPFPDGEFDLVALVNMIPFFEELARVTAPRGTVVLAFSRGRATPIYVPAERVRAELGARGFSDVREVSAGEGTALVAGRG